MKKWIILMLCLSVFCMVACGKKDGKEVENKTTGSETSEITTILKIKINPEISIYVNHNNEIVDVVYGNDDANIYKEINKELLGNNVTDAVKLIIDTTIEKGYLKDGKAIEIDIVQGVSESENKKLLDMAKSGTEESLNKNNVAAQICLKVAGEDLEDTKSTTEENTSKVTDETTEKQTQKETSTEETTTQKVTVIEPTQPSTQKPTQATTQKPTEATTQKPTQATTQKPTQETTQAPTQKPTETTTEPAKPTLKFGKYHAFKVDDTALFESVMMFNEDGHYSTEGYAYCRKKDWNSTRDITTVPSVVYNGETWYQYGGSGADGIPYTVKDDIIILDNGDKIKINLDGSLLVIESDRIAGGHGYGFGSHLTFME